MAETTVDPHQRALVVLKVNDFSAAGKRTALDDRPKPVVLKSLRVDLTKSWPARVLSVKFGSFDEMALPEPGKRFVKPVPCAFTSLIVLGIGALKSRLIAAKHDEPSAESAKNVSSIVLISVSPLLKYESSYWHSDLSTVASIRLQLDLSTNH
jgi:hypothetical protein